ncbi:MAG: hypothetical protein Q8R83_00275 [Legionellaceae bacterium]|nr:hypothetical protein [Legionellaceae bacterium]
MTNRTFSERLNNELNAIGMPEHFNERVETFSKTFKTPRFKSEGILNGNIRPDDDLLKLLSQELEVNVSWLLGEDKSKH